MSQGNNEGERGIIRRFGTLGKVMERLWMLLNFRKGHDQGFVMKGCHPAETPTIWGRKSCDEKEKNKGKWNTNE